ncbi:hypothetical protein L5515_001260 [Caenorhabditis briggsae]|nr:hypothetical protein L3Y34_015185 [Caenorhabditis briggsae]UMM12526.1 hypothetical protein L5515_001260 [Caenorhabditis briggsae]
MFSSHKIVEFLQQFLDNQEADENEEKKPDDEKKKVYRKEQHAILLSEFCLHKFTPDIIILLKMINNHTGDIVCTEIVGRMWNDFLKRDAKLVLQKFVDNDPNMETKSSSLKSVQLFEEHKGLI